MNRIQFVAALAACGLSRTFVSSVYAQSGAAGAASAKPIASTASSIFSPIFVLNSLEASVSVIDPRTWSETKRIATGKEPHHLYLTPDEKSVIVANAAGDSLTFIDPKSGDVQRTIRGILDPYHLRFSPDMKWLVTAANRLNHIDIYAWSGSEPKLAKRISSSKTPSHINIDSKSTTAYVTMQDSNELVAVDLATQQLRWRTPTGQMPADIYLTADDKYALVGLTASDGVQVFDVSTPGQTPGKLIKTIPTGKGAHAFRAAGDKRHVFVSNRVANTVNLIDTQSLQVTARINLPGGPDCMEVSADGQWLYVTSRWAKKLTVVEIASGKIVQSINVGRSPHGVWTLDHASRL